MNLRSFLHTLTLCLLTLCVGSLGPAALAAAPRSLTLNAQEEERNSAESDVVGNLGTSVLRPARPSAKSDRFPRRAARPCESCGRPGQLVERRCASTLCELQVRIQV